MYSNAKDNKNLARSFGWKTPVLKDAKKFENSLKVNPGAQAIMEQIAILCGANDNNDQNDRSDQNNNLSRFFFIKSQVRAKAIKFLTEKKEKLGIPPKARDTPKLVFPHKNIYRGDFPELAVRCDLIKGNFHTARFFGFVSDNMEYFDFIKQFVVQVADEYPEKLQQKHIELCTRVLSKAKQFRQVVFGEVFKSSVNKLVKYITWCATDALLKDDLWKTYLNKILLLDCTTSDEVIFVPKDGVECDIDAFIEAAGKISDFFKNISIKGRDDIDKPMTPIRVEVSKMTSVESKLTGQAGLLGGTSGICEKILFTTDPNKHAGEVRIKHIPKELYALFYKRIHDIPFDDNDYFFEYNGMLARIAEHPVFETK